MGDPDKGKEIQPRVEAAAKLEAIREATKHSFPAGDIGQILDEIERGYQR